MDPPVKPTLPERRHSSIRPIWSLLAAVPTGRSHGCRGTMRRHFAQNRARKRESSTACRLRQSGNTRAALGQPPPGASATTTTILAIMDGPSPAAAITSYIMWDRRSRIHSGFSTCTAMRQNGARTFTRECYQEEWTLWRYLPKIRTEESCNVSRNLHLGFDPFGVARLRRSDVVSPRTWFSRRTRSWRAATVEREVKMP